MRFLAIGAVMMAGVLAAAGAAQDPPRADRPDVKVGDTWTIRNKDGRTGAAKAPTIITVTAVTPDNMTARAGSQTYLTITRDWNHLETRVGDRVAASSRPAWMLYQFPLQVGKKWDGRWETADETQVSRWNGKSHVEKIESITVPAGTFQTFKVRFEGTYNSKSKNTTDSWTGFRKETMWYAPAVRRAVKTEWEERSGSYYNKEVNELMSFKLVP
jgi:hypothetical protein